MTERLSRSERKLKIDFFAVEVRRRNIERFNGKLNEGFKKWLGGGILTIFDQALDTGFGPTVEGLNSRNGWLISWVDAPAIDRGGFSFEEVLSERRAVAEQYGYSSRFLGVAFIDRTWSLTSTQSEGRSPIVPTPELASAAAERISLQYGFVPLIGEDADLNERMDQALKLVRSRLHASSTLF